MKKFFLRISIIFFIIFVQINFLDLVFLKNNFVNLSILTLISWIIITDFEKIWIWIVVLGFFNDIFLAEKIGHNIILFILLAYLISFVSKRFMIERKLSGFLLVVLFIVAGNFLGNIFNVLFAGSEFLKEDLFYGIKNYFDSWQNFIITNVISGICFYFIYILINKIEKYIAISENRLKIPF